jgi:hypothetical protein
MGSHPTLADRQLAAEAQQLDHRVWIHDHQRMAERNAEQASTGSTLPSASPPTAPTPSATATSSSVKPPSPSASESPSTTAAKMTATRSSGSPAKTTEPPRPSKPPATSPLAPSMAPSGWAPNANQHKQGAHVMAEDNHTTIVGNLIEDPELRSPTTASPSRTCGWR